MPTPCARRHAGSCGAFLGLLVALAGRYSTSPSRGGSSQQSKFDGVRKISPAEIALPRGYRVEAVATGLTFPTDVTFDDQGRAYFIQSGYSYGERWSYRAPND